MLNWIKHVVAGSALFLVAPSLFAVENDISRRIEELIAGSGNINIGIHVQDLTTGEILYQKNADRTFIPASNQKMFTAVAALTQLHPEYQFKTRILATTHQVTGGQLNGDIYFQFSGDPSLRIRDVNALIASLKSQGIQQINGKVYVDFTAFENHGWGPGWVWNDTRYCFSAPINAGILNQNCLNVQIVPGGAVGAPIKIIPNEASQSVAVINKATTQSANRKGCYVQLENNATAATDPNTYVLEGCLRLNSKQQTLSIPLTHPEAFATRLVDNLLHKNGINFRQPVERGGAEGPLVTLAEHSSKPLGGLVKTMLKESDNLISDTVYKRLGYTYFSQGTWKTGALAVRKVLNSRAGIGLEKKTVIADGSGLSRYNLVSPQEVSGLLNYAYHNPAISGTFIKSLPIGGIDGTLKYRMHDITGRVSAKTGTMVNVSALSGYLKTRRNHTLAFSILTNGVVGPMHKYKLLEDEICQYLVNAY